MTLLDLYPDGSYSVFEDVDGDTFSLRMRGFVIGVKEDLLNYSWEMYSGRKYRRSRIWIVGNVVIVCMSMVVRFRRYR